MTTLLPPLTMATPDVATLYRDHARQVWRMLARLGVMPPFLEDAVQDVFLTAHQRLPDFEGRSSVKTWLLGITVRIAANARRRKQPPLTVVPEGAPRPDEALEQRRRLEALDAVLRKLPDEQREVLVLIDLEQLSAPEVSDALEVKLNTVYSRLRLARAALHTALQESP